MGRGGGGLKPKKRKKVLVTPAERMQGGKPTEVYRILGELVDEHREDLAEAEIVILWRSGWRSDPDGWTQMVNVKKAGDVDRALSVKADFAVMLNKELFPKLPDRMKHIYLHHAIEHMRPMIDADGEQKQDDKGRKLWRVKKRHDVEQHSVIVKVYGEESLNLDREALLAIKDADQPLLTAAEKAGSNGSGEATDADADAWKSLGIGAAAFKENHHDALEAAGIKTLGQLQAAMNEHGQFWASNNKINGRYRQPIEDAFNAYLIGFAKAG